MPEYRNGDIYIASVLLEINRWTPDKEPSFLVSDWLERFAQAGFDGIELWDFHATKADNAEIEKLARANPPVRIFNSYAKLDDAALEDRRTSAQIAKRLGAKGMKFNFGNDPALRDESIRNVRAWLADLPADFRMLCECHPNTLAEEPEDARELFEAIDDPRLEAMIHPLRMREDDPSKLRGEFLEKWFDILGPRVTHTHIQTRPERNVQAIREAFDILEARGYRGTHSLEFTVGTRTEGETMDLLWGNALEDLRILRECSK